MTGAARRTVAAGAMLHIRGFGGSPLGGLSTLASAGRLWVALSVERAAALTFRQRRALRRALEYATRQLSRASSEEAEEQLHEKYQAP
jgi:hypothetical protein